MQIEIFSDVVCPWCYIGKRRLEQALSTFPHADEVTITYRSFQLDPTAPRRSEETLEQHLAAKYGRTLDEARQMNQRVSDIAATVGLDFRLADAQRGNTFDAHRLLHLAAARGAAGRAEGAPDEGLLHRGRPDQRPRRAGRAGRRGRAGRGRGRRGAGRRRLRRRGARRTSRWPAGSASPACRSSWSTAPTACPARRRRRC